MTTFSFWNSTPFTQAFIVPPVSTQGGSYDTIPGTDWVSINATASSQPPSSGYPYTTTYRRTFALPAVLPSSPATLSLSVTVLADNAARVLLNGNMFGTQPCFTTGSCTASNFKNPPPTYTDTTPTDFIPLNNVLEFQVRDDTPYNTGLDYIATLTCTP